MSRIWCVRKGKARGFMNALVACDCRKRKTCLAYAEVSLPNLASANMEAKNTGYQAAEELLFLEAAQMQSRG